MKLTIDPIPALLNSDHPAVVYFTRRDLLDEAVEPLQSLWELPAALSLIHKQQPGGHWRYTGKYDARSNHDLVETFRVLGYLVCQYGLDQRHPAIQTAARYLFSCQSSEGDLRGILGTQYMPYYHGALLDLLIQAGYQDEAEIHKGLDWLLSVQQADGGWLVPLQAVRPSEKDALYSAPPLAADTGLPSSHLATGMALRALAAHPDYRSIPAVQRAGEWLAGRLLKPDSYNDRKAPGYWLKFRYPFWWTDLVSALDCLAKLGISAQQANLPRGLAWLRQNQAPDGLWMTEYEKAKDRTQRQWVGLAICRVLKAYLAL